MKKRKVLVHHEFGVCLWEGIGKPGGGGEQGRLTSCVCKEEEGGEHGE